MSHPLLKKTLKNAIELFEQQPGEALSICKVGTELGNGSSVRAKAKSFEFSKPPIPLKYGFVLKALSFNDPIIRLPNYSNVTALDPARNNPPFTLF